ncbi:MAG: NADPH-dependent F420 reductase [Chloroflexota bacterium]
MPESLPAIAVLGGTGKEGKGLAYRWARAGYPVVIGSRTPEKAQAAVAAIAARLAEAPHTPAKLEGSDNLSAARQADILVLTVPYAAHRATLESIRDAAQGKLLIDVTVPLVPPKVTKVQMPPAGSAAQEAHQILGDGVEVVDAFQNISHEHLFADRSIDCDVLVAGTSKSARQRALELVQAAGMTGWDAGPLENAVVVEGLTSLLIYINKQYGASSAGIRITGASPT